MSSWPIVRLGDLAAREESAIAIGPFGSRMKADNYVSSGVRVIRGQNITDTGGLAGEYVYVSEEFASTLGPARLIEGDIVLPHRGAIGRAALVSPGDYVMSTSLMRIRLDRSSACPEYVTAFLCSNTGQQEILKFASTVGTPGIGQPLASLRQVKLPLPPIEQQRQIAGVLGTLDDLIDANRRIAQDCTELWRAMVRDALADASKSVQLSDLADFVNGRNFTNGAAGRGRPVIRTPEVRRGPDLGTVRNDVDAADEHVAREGDILFVWSGSLTVGRWMWEEGIINQHVFKVLPKPGVPGWLVFALIEYQMPWFLSLAADKATTMGHIKREHLDAAVPVPSAPEIKRLDRIIEPLWNEALQCGIAMEELSRTRDELLPLLMSGRVMVEDVAA